MICRRPYMDYITCFGLIRDPYMGYMFWFCQRLCMVNLYLHLLFRRPNTGLFAYGYSIWWRPLWVSIWNNIHSICMFWFCTLWTLVWLSCGIAYSNLSKDTYLYIRCTHICTLIPYLILIHHIYYCDYLWPHLCGINCVPFR